MKHNGTGHIRNPTNPNVRVQDGKKLKLLCEDCEQAFSRRESWFAANVFQPYLSGVQSFPYGPELKYFAMSLFWRRLVSRTRGLPETQRHEPLLGEAAEEWRECLLRNQPPRDFNDFHLFLTDVGSADGTQPVANWSQYTAGSVDGAVACSRESCVVYVKFARFMFFAAVYPNSIPGMIRTQILDAGSMATPQEIQNTDISGFIVDRARVSNEMYQRAISPRQRAIIAQSTRTQINQGQITDAIRLMMADSSAIITPPFSMRRVGPNDQCPCGSGKKTKRCHRDYL